MDELQKIISRWRLTLDQNEIDEDCKSTRADSARKSQLVELVSLSRVVVQVMFQSRNECERAKIVGFETALTQYSFLVATKFRTNSACIQDLKTSDAIDRNN